MLQSFEDSNIRVLIKYVESAIWKPGGQDLETLPDNPELVRQRHQVIGVEIIDVHSKSIINLSVNAAMAIAEGIREIHENTPPPISIHEVELSW